MGGGTRVARPHQTGLIGKYDELSPAAGVGLGHHATEVGLDGRLGQEHGSGDLRVRTAACYLLEYFEFAVGQR